MTNEPLTADDIEAIVEGERPIKEPLKFLGRTEVALYLGLRGLPSLTGVKLPEPDAIIGDRKGWTETTIDEWQSRRPGRGRWGERPVQDYRPEVLAAQQAVDET